MLPGREGRLNVTSPLVPNQRVPTFAELGLSVMGEDLESEFDAGWIVSPAVQAMLAIGPTPVVHLSDRLLPFGMEGRIVGSPDGISPSRVELSFNVNNLEADQAFSSFIPTTLLDADDMECFGEEEEQFGQDPEALYS